MSWTYPRKLCGELLENVDVDDVVSRGLDPVDDEVTRVELGSA